jgi:hypothetical protein
MASVYITDELKKRTAEVINKMRKQEISNDAPNYDNSCNVDASHLYHLGCWGKEHIHLLHIIPKDWLRVESTVSIAVEGNNECGQTITFTQSFDSKVPVFYGRPSTDYWNRVMSKLHIDDIRAMPEETPGRAEILRRWDNELIVRSINDRWAKVSEDVTQFLGKCKSLNEAVKLFPTVRMYIHRDDLERLDRKVERASERKAIVKDVDTDGLTAAAIAAKLMAAA